jgi:5-(carboxyamino)imidazole ribonucleotide synthase
MFLANGGDKMQVLLNEVAPRPHNSGHFTMDACETSQFEQVLLSRASILFLNS